jgi:intraflagellar transport protein 80
MLIFSRCVRLSVPFLCSGAVTSLAWNQDGTSLITAGEDGAVKQYSRKGDLRSKLAQAEQPVYAVVWSPDQQSVLYCTGRYVLIKPLAVSAKLVKWKVRSTSGVICSEL